MNNVVWGRGWGQPWGPALEAIVPDGGASVKAEGEGVLKPVPAFANPTVMDVSEAIETISAYGPADYARAISEILRSRDVDVICAQECSNNGLDGMVTEAMVDNGFDSTVTKAMVVPAADGSFVCGCSDCIKRLHPSADKGIADVSRVVKAFEALSPVEFTELCDTLFRDIWLHCTHGCGINTAQVVCTDLDDRGCYICDCYDCVGRMQLYVC